jgi:hypothetical protein
MDWHPFAERFPLLEGGEREALKESIKKTRGIDEQPILYRLVNGKIQGLDGRNRFLICKELRIKPKMKKVSVKDEDAKDFIMRRNVHRRHLTRELRQQIVADLRADGESTRQIAESLGVSVGTIHSDIKAAGASVQVFNSEHLGTVTGKDGKTYAANQPLRLCRPCRVSGKPKPDCPDCAALRKPAPEPGADTETFEAEGAAKPRPGNGQAQFDWKIFNSALGVLARLVDTLANSYGLHLKDTPEKDGAHRKLWEFREAVKVFFEKLTKQKAPR